MKVQRGVSIIIGTVKCSNVSGESGLHSGDCVQSLFMSPYNSANYARILLVLFFAGVCLGMQLAVCEFARNVLGWEGK